MEELPRGDILKLGVSFLKMFGEYMHCSSKKLQAWRLLNVICLVIPTWFTILNLKHAIGVEYMETIEGTCTLIHILIKYLLLIYYKPNIDELLDAKSMFWKYERFTNETRNAKAVFRYVKFVQNYLMISMCFVVTMFWLRPYLESNTRFMYPCWIYPDSVVLETIVLACQYYTLGAAIPIVLGTMTVETKMEEFRECLEYHHFLLSLFKRINAVYFWMLLFHYFVTLATGCAELYIILLGQVDNREIVASMFYNISLYIEFGYYAFPAELLVSEFRKASNAIYASTWYEQDIKIQKMLLFTMIKAQRQRYMVAGGIVEMNVNTFSSVIRRTFSFYAISKNILNK